MTPQTRLVAIGAPGDVHITRQLFAAFQAGREGVPRLSATTPLDEMADVLNEYRPDRVRIAIARELEAAGAAPTTIRVEPVDEIEREPGQAAKLKLVTSAR